MKPTKPKAPAPDLYWIEEIVRLLDSKYRLPGTRFRFGLDPIIGFFPVIGDLTSFVISGGLILYMLRYGVSRKVVILMLLNISVDAVIGSIPVIGNIFDFYFKANSRNIKLLRQHYQEEKHQGKGTWIILLVAAVLILIIFLLLWGLWQFIDWLAAL
jgi:hypothetical protein